jgi:WhiB family redox-sensing transcriptional regulator
MTLTSDARTSAAAAARPSAAVGSLGLMGPGNWRDAAACRGLDPELFFPIGTTAPAVAQLQEAKAVCGTCSVREPCLQWALRSEPIGQENGVYAGLSEGERRAIKRRTSRARNRPEAAATAAREA